MKSYKSLLCLLLSLLLLLPLFCMPALAEEADETQDTALTLSCPSAVLMEASTGCILYEKDAVARLPMASVTKVMTLLLIFESIENGQISPETQVSVSEHAASMGGSQVFLEAGEIQTVETLIKCISIASANDAAVAMAETVAGSEEAFVALMNEKAAALSMENTHFVNCCGLDDTDHYSCAKDLALLSRQLILRFPAIYDYCQIWQEDITHTTKKGQTPFTLTNTNKLLKSYPYATGLKTGSTSLAKFCLSATASKDNIDLIAVIMAAPTSKDRIRDAQSLFAYGFANTAIYQDKTTEKILQIPVKKGVADTLHAVAKQDFSYLDQKKADLSQITSKQNLPENLTAPIKKGDTVGSIDYYLGDKQIGSIPVVAKESIAAAGYGDILQELFCYYCFVSKSVGR